jgi:glycerol-3-phosphate dehydrogenase
VGDNNESTDVLIIGGGANGCGLARDLAKRGVRVILCEKADFGRGATNNSTAMIHGGPRYLLTDPGTTKHSCSDSGHIQKIAPHLLFRIPFLIPVPKSMLNRHLAMLLHDVFFNVYDRYSALKNGLRHARLSLEELHALEPGVQGDFLGAIATDEWGIDPGRLCMLNVLDAAAFGARIWPYSPVLGLLQNPAGEITGATVQRGGTTVEVHAKLVVNCAGAWASDIGKWAGGGVRIRPGKGVHLIYEKRISNFCVMAYTIDGRQIFLLPQQNETWVGTTDDDYYGSLDDVPVTHDEIEYLRQGAEFTIPAFAKQRLIGTRAGVRNTMYGEGCSEDDLSRGYEIVEHEHVGKPAVARRVLKKPVGMLSFVGGKLASYRVQAEEMADRVCQLLGVEQKSQTCTHTLPGGDAMPNPLDLVREYGISLLQARRLTYRHGSWVTRVLDIGRETATGFCVVDPYEPVLECEVRYCIRHEYVTTLGDLMMRCRLAMGGDFGANAAVRAAQIFSEERGLDVTDMRAAEYDLLARRYKTAAPIMGIGAVR